MNIKDNITVLKFGSSVLRSEADLPKVVHEIYRAWREGQQVIAVVSAFGDTTDQLLRRAENLCGQPDKSALATLLATGESASSALLVLALSRAGIPARVFDAAQIGLRTTGGRLDADPISVDSARLVSESRRSVVVLPGFVGRGESGDTTLLGRGGSDLTALFLAHRLSARCVLVKDVNGLYTSDPACRAVCASRFAEASYKTAAQVGGSVVQLKAVRFAEANRLRFSITSIGSGKATEVGPITDRLDNDAEPSEPLRVALLGCGTVGGGVYQRLAAMPELFTVVGVGTRTGKGPSAVGVPSNLDTSDLEALVERPCDVVVELIGGTKRAAALVESSLRLGRNVITANKALMASTDGDALEILAEEAGASLRYSAAVGGVLPALETVNRAKMVGPLKGFSGVLNGTCNFVLDRIAAGASMSTAVRDAQDLGYAEAQPQFDLSGIDAAQKLILLTRAAFGISPRLESIPRKGIEELNNQKLRQAEQQGQVIRLVARCYVSEKGIESRVEPIALPLNHPLAQTHGAENCLLIEPEVGEPWVISGTGAGRWPTTEAVMADLFDLRRAAQLLETSGELEELEECVA
ncbi:MAG TPA: homoserine dehydrogenase [Pyrinomonadaceae bacterium]|jgi:homoserine dehydrogenase